MKRNFDIVDMIILKSINREWDLHNEFEISNIKYNPNLESLAICFIRIWPQPNSHEGITLFFKKIDFINFNIETGSIKNSEMALSFVGYLPSDQLQVSDSCYENYSRGSAMIFNFEDGTFITIRSEVVDLQPISN